MPQNRPGYIDTVVKLLMRTFAPVSFMFYAIFDFDIGYQIIKVFVLKNKISYLIQKYCSARNIFDGYRLKFISFSKWLLLIHYDLLTVHSGIKILSLLENECYTLIVYYSVNFLFLLVYHMLIICTNDVHNTKSGSLCWPIFIV